MASTTVSKEIAAPTDKVWDAVANLKGWSDWNTLFTKWKSEPPAEVNVGTEATAVMTIMGMANTITLTIDEFTGPKTLVTSGTGMAGAKVKLTLSLEPQGAGTLVTADTEFVSQMMVGAIGGAVERAAKKELDASLIKLAAIVE